MSEQHHRARWEMAAGRRPAVLSPQAILRIICCLSLCLTLQHVAGATPVTVQARLAESEISLGESTTLELHMHGLRHPDQPDLTHPAIDVTKAGGQSFSHSSYSMINGQARQTEEFGYVARYSLRPRRAGTLEIPPLVVVHEGQRYQSNPLALRVRRPPEQDFLIVEVHTNKPSYVLGESVTLTLDLSIRKLMSNGSVLDVEPFFRAQPPHLQIPWFDSLGDWKTTDLKTFVQPLLGQPRAGFAVNAYRREGLLQNALLTFTLPRQSTQRTTPRGTLEYFTYQLQKQFRPVHASVQVIPPVLVKAHLPTQVDARGQALSTEKFVVSSPTLTVAIRPVPTTGQPASFRGAVGRFHLEVEAHPTVLRVGDPLSLTLTLRGEGVWETVQPPALERQLGQDFKVQADPPGVKTDHEAKTYTYTLRPRHAHIREIPSVEVAYFDPEAQRFQVLRSAPVPLRVEAASALEVSEVIDTASDTPTSVLGQERTAGMLANYSGEEVLRPQHFQIQIGLGTRVLLVLPPVAYGAALLWRRRTRQRRQRPEQQRARKAARRALTALRTLRVQPGDVAVCEGVQQVLTGYIGAKLHLVGAGLTVDDVTRHLQARRVDQTLIEQVATLLHLCDSARYAPGSLAVAQLTGLPEDAAALVQQLEASGRW